MILPYSVVGATVRRWPLVTLALIALNALCFVGELAAQRAVAADVAGDYRKLVDYQAAHPYLALPPLLVSDSALRGLASKLKHADVPDDLSEADVEDEQQQFNVLCARVERRLDNEPTRRFGFIPKDGVTFAILSYMFLHGGVVHLLDNMWFLWLACATVEDRWGRVPFALFYVVSGVVAALVHMAAAPSSAAPLVGASGAIAGAMGAFSVLFMKERIRVAYILGFRLRQFVAPAYILLPAWLVLQVFFARSTGGSDGVAYWAHVGGFLFGAAVAGTLRLTGADERLEQWSAGMRSSRAGSAASR